MSDEPFLIFAHIFLILEAMARKEKSINVPVHLYELAALCRRHGLQIAPLVESFNGTR